MGLGACGPRLAGSRALLAAWAMDGSASSAQVRNPSGVADGDTLHVDKSPVQVETPAPEAVGEVFSSSRSAGAYGVGSGAVGGDGKAKFEKVKTGPVAGGASGVDALALDHKARMAIQRGLGSLKFDAGPVDGMFGNKTRGCHQELATGERFPCDRIPDARSGGSVESRRTDKG